MKTNKKTKTPAIKTHEGAIAARTTVEKQLERSVMSCFLWEDEFYEDGKEIGQRIVELARQVETGFLADLAVKARKEMYLRHVPLLLLSVLAERQGQIVSETIANVISRVDEMAELLSVHAKKHGVKAKGNQTGFKKIVSNQIKQGLAAVFHKFDEYQLAKYNREGDITLKDVVFLCHIKDYEENLVRKVVKDELTIPGTWENKLSAGQDKKTAFTQLIQDGDLGYLALLRNLRNMEKAGVDRDLVLNAIRSRKGARYVLPHRYVAAARHAVWAEPALDEALQAAIKELPKLPGRTAVLVDVSGSMDAPLSGKSDLKRIDAAAALASILNCEDLRVFTFSYDVKEVPARRGMAGIEAVINSQAHGGTYLGGALDKLKSMKGWDRVIVITDEQSHDRVRGDGLAPRLYLINVASAKNGVGYGKPWVHIDGFSENVIKFIVAYEAEND